MTRDAVHGLVIPADIRAPIQVRHMVPSLHALQEIVFGDLHTWFEWVMFEDHGFEMGFDSQPDRHAAQTNTRAIVLAHQYDYEGLVRGNAIILGVGENGAILDAPAGVVTQVTEMRLG